VEFPYKLESVPMTGYYYGFTLDGKEICQRITSLEECQRLINEYQKANGNPLCTIRVLVPVYQHYGSVYPLKQTELDAAPQQKESRFVGTHADELVVLSRAETDKVRATAPSRKKHGKKKKKKK
jgi:hypothetical protein